MALVVCVSGCGNPNNASGNAGDGLWTSRLNGALVSNGFAPLRSGDLVNVSVAELLARGGGPEAVRGPGRGSRSTQVYRYLSDPSVRREVRESVARAIVDDTRIVIAHSLGSIVAYETLCRLTASPVRLLITAGSPLGMRPAVFERLDSGLESERVPWPNGLMRWVNVYDRCDPIAFRRLAPLFGCGRQVVDRLVVNGLHPHGLSGYLSASVVARELGQACGGGLSAMSPSSGQLVDGT